MTRRADVSKGGEAAALWLRARGVGRPRLAIVLGSGLAGSLSVATQALVAGFEEIPGLPSTSVAGHPGRLVAGTLHGAEVVILEGRFHLYEDRGWDSIQILAATLGAIGVKTVLLTTAAGALAQNLKVGEFVVVRDQLVYPLGGAASATGRARVPERRSAGRASPGARRWPARGLERPGGTRAVYDPDASATLERACLDAGVLWRRGLLALAVGPCYETGAEARLLRMAGADVVSMSAAADALAARRQGLAVCCLCCVTNKVGLWRRSYADHEDVLVSAELSKRKISAALEKFVYLTAREGTA